MDIPQKNILHGPNQNEAIVVGFEAPKSPDASYNNVYPEDNYSKGPPTVPYHLDQTLLNASASRVFPGSLPLPHNATLNHVYCEKKENEGKVVALGLTHRFREKYVTVVLYKAAPRGGSTSN